MFPKSEVIANKLRLGERSEASGSGNQKVAQAVSRWRLSQGIN